MSEIEITLCTSRSDDKTLQLHQRDNSYNPTCLLCGTADSTRWYTTFTPEQYQATEYMFTLISQIEKDHPHLDGFDSEWKIAGSIEKLIDPLADKNCGDGFETVCGDCVDSTDLDERIRNYVGNTCDHYSWNVLPEGDNLDRCWAARHLGYTLKVHEYRDPWMTGEHCPDCGVEVDARIASFNKSVKLDG